jgi:Domain of unknown function (DUF4258)
VINLQRLIYTYHAQMRMLEEDIDEQEVREALAAPASQHWFNTKHQTMNVKRRLSVTRKTLLVAYDERGTYTKIVSTYWV